VSTDISTTQLQPPPFRVLWADSFSGAIVVVLGVDTSESGATWNLLTEPDPGAGKQDGVELMELSRRSLPEIGKATFRMLYGRMPSGNVAAPVSLLNKEIRLELQNQDGVWETVFWGHVDYEEEQAFPGSQAGIPQGGKVFYCLDGFARTQKWFLNRHGFDPLKDGIVGHQLPDAYGHPGYNYYLSADGPLIGNKSPYTYVQDGVTIKMHIWQGAFSTSINDATYAWNDFEAIVNAVSVTKPIGEPWFNLREGSANYGAFTPLMVGAGETVHAFVSRVCGRKRGLGTVALKWKKVAGGLYGQLQVWLGVTPINSVSIPFTYIVSGAGGQVDGASAYTDVGTGRNLQYQTAQLAPLDLRGDARNDDGLYFLGTMEGQQFDYIETAGEQIEVALTLSLQDTATGMAGIYDVTKQLGVAPRWSSDDRDTFEGLTVSNRVQDRWRHVYQAFGLPRWWGGMSGDGLASAVAQVRVDCRCKDDGSVFQPTPAFPIDTAGSSCELLSYLPFYYGFKYDGIVPIRTDNSPSNGMPDRRPAQVYLRPTATAEDRWFLPFGQLPSTFVDKFNFRAYLGNFNPTVMVQPDSIQVISQQFSDLGLRPMADTSREGALADANKLGAQYDITRLAITVAVRLPYRLRFCSAPSVPEVNVRLVLYPATGFKDWQKAKRKKTIYVPRAHLWLAHGACIWDLSQTSVTVEGFQALRTPLNATTTALVGTIRDDRDRVQFFHMVAQYWYLNLRRRIRVAQKYCGLLPFKKLVAGVDTTDYPVQINDHLNTVYLNGDVDGVPSTVSTNVTSVDYNHQTFETVWGTDYFDLDFSV